LPSYFLFNQLGYFFRQGMRHCQQILNCAALFSRQSLWKQRYSCAAETAYQFDLPAFISFVIASTIKPSFSFSDISEIACAAILENPKSPQPSLLGVNDSSHQTFAAHLVSYPYLGR
jgi:hypothetical protein